MTTNTITLLNDININLSHSKSLLEPARFFLKKGCKGALGGVNYGVVLGNLEAWSLSFYHCDIGVYYEIEF